MVGEGIDPQWLDKATGPTYLKFVRGLAMILLLWLGSSGFSLGEKTLDPVDLFGSGEERWRASLVCPAPEGGSRVEHGRPACASTGECLSCRLRHELGRSWRAGARVISPVLAGERPARETTVMAPVSRRSLQLPLRVKVPAGRGALHRSVHSVWRC